MKEGNTLTMALPLRGNIQVRVLDISGLAITCVTLQGHPLSGAIRFVFEERPGGIIRFEVRSFTRPSDLVDLIGMRTFGKVAQKTTWRSLVGAIVERSGGQAVAGVEEEETRLHGQDAEDVENWVEELVLSKKREQAPVPGAPARDRAA